LDNVERAYVVVVIIIIPSKLEMHRDAHLLIIIMCFSLLFILRLSYLPITSPPPMITCSLQFSLEVFDARTQRTFLLAL